MPPIREKILIPAVMAVGLFTAAGGMPRAVRAQNNGGFPPPSPQGQGPHIPTGPTLTRKQRRDLLKYNFKQMQRNVQQLVALAKSLQAEIQKSNPDELSVNVIRKAKKIQKLAKKIQVTARGY